MSKLCILGLPSPHFMRLGCISPRLGQISQTWPECKCCMRLPPVTCCVVTCPQHPTKINQCQICAFWVFHPLILCVWAAFLPNLARFPKLGQNANAAYDFHQWPVVLWLDNNIQPRLTSVKDVHSGSSIPSFHAFGLHFSQTWPHFPNLARMQMLHETSTSDLLCCDLTTTSNQD